MAGPPSDVARVRKRGHVEAVAGSASASIRVLMIHHIPSEPRLIRSSPSAQTWPSPRSSMWTTRPVGEPGSENVSGSTGDTKILGSSGNACGRGRRHPEDLCLLTTPAGLSIRRRTRVATSSSVIGVESSHLGSPPRSKSLAILSLSAGLVTTVTRRPSTWSSSVSSPTASFVRSTVPPRFLGCANSCGAPAPGSGFGWVRLCTTPNRTGANETALRAPARHRQDYRLIQPPVVLSTPYPRPCLRCATTHSGRSAETRPAPRRFGPGCASILGTPRRSTSTGDPSLLRSSRHGHRQGTSRPRLRRRRPGRRPGPWPDPGGDRRPRGRRRLRRASPSRTCRRSWAATTSATGATARATPSTTPTGRGFLDFACGIATTSLGHHHPGGDCGDQGPGRQAAAHLQRARLPRAGRPAGGDAGRRLPRPARHRLLRQLRRGGRRGGPQAGPPRHRAARASSPSAAPSTAGPSARRRSPARASTTGSATSRCCRPST